MSGTVMPTCSTPRKPGSQVPSPVVVGSSSTLPPFELACAIVLPTGVVDPEEPKEAELWKYSLLATTARPSDSSPAIQSFGNLGASAVAGLLWTAFSKS